MKQSSNVPTFLSKMWTLVEETHTNEIITWKQNGQSFLVLDEQGFAKEILPKYFKHNNMANFVRQLNMYGFRKAQERDGPVEFQHPYFKQGQDDLLENIKRKVSSSKPEENKNSSAQKVQIKQETVEYRLSELKSENESLWKEVSELRAKHAQQQQVIRKIVQFIVTLVQNNQLVTPKKNLFQHIVKEPTDNYHHKVPHSRTEVLKPREMISDDIIIYNVTDDNANEENIPVIPETGILYHIHTLYHIYIYLYLSRMLYMVPPIVPSTLILSPLKMTMKMSMHLSFRVESRVNQPENP
uniref:HSF-type DNA-binding domain-containing protein n=1 Tax=Rhinopithecus roxellana TaxID=61622 RepID=A0A2K6PJ62_RHIRO